VTLEPTPHAYSPSRCPFCAADATHADRTATLGCPIWRCACGGVGVGGQPMDIDEAIDELTATVGLAFGALGRPRVEPVGTSGMLSAAYIDPDAMATTAIAAAPPGWQVGRSTATLSVTWRDGTVHDYEQIVIWARRSGS
jgi:hypothetical protein